MAFFFNISFFFSGYRVSIPKKKIIILATFFLVVQNSFAIFLCFNEEDRYQATKVQIFLTAAYYNNLPADQEYPVNGLTNAESGTAAYESGEAETVEAEGSFLKRLDTRREGPFLIKFLIAVIIYSILSMLVLLAVILLHRNKMELVDKITQELKEKYQSLLMDYLFDEEHQSETLERINKAAGDTFKRQILMSQMKDLMVNLSGDAAEKLSELYYKLDLDRDSEEKALSSKWHIKVKGFRELALMNVTRVNEEIARCLHSRNSILRMEAQLALVRLGDEDRFVFLDHLERPFTPWEQLNVHQTIVSHNLEIPSFERWLGTANPTVVIFSLRMISLFCQTGSWRKVAEQLDSPFEKVRREAVHTLGELRVREALPYLKQHYKKEIYENSLEIVRAIRKMPDESVLNFLKLVIDKEDDIQLQIEAAKAIYEMGNPGIKALQKIMKSEYKNYQIIIKHVLDRRI